MIQNGESAVYYEKPADPAAGEKKYVRRAGNAIGITCIAISVIFRYWYVGILFVTTRLGISQEAVLKTLRNNGIQQLVQVVVSTVCFIFPFMIAAKALNVSVSGSLPFKMKKKGVFWPYLFLGLAFCAFANISLSSAARVFEWLGFSYNMPAESLPTGALGFLLYLISTAVVPAMAEEFGMRGLTLGILRPLGDGFAIIGSAVVFGAMHGNFMQMPFTFAVGIVLAYIRIKTGSMLVCILVHGINNLAAVILHYLEGVVSTTAINVGYTVFLCVCLAIGFAGLRRIDKTDDLGIEPAATASPEKKKFGWFVSAPGMIVFLSLEFIYALTWLF